MIKVIESIPVIKEVLKKHRGGIGFVPTMGALHQGHASLIDSSLKENDLTVVSIYVNQTQFNNINDYKAYPLDLENDQKFITNINKRYQKNIIIFIPSYDEMYPDNYLYKVTENDFSHKLCGKVRPGHFDGVLTIVLKFLNIIKPQFLYMGIKDYQQLTLIQKMINAFMLDTELKKCETIRDEFGLPLSSRNRRLDQAGLACARNAISIFHKYKDQSKMKAELLKTSVRIDYLESIDRRMYIAFFVDEVRLIDNKEI